jgi:isocitrate dehydrogenase (NAD+)
MVHTVTLIPGDWIGPEVSEAVRRIIAAAGVQIDWDIQVCGLKTFESEKTLVPDRVIDSIRRNKVALKAPIGTPSGADIANPTAYLRKVLDLYCNIRPMRNIWGLKCKYPDLDVVIIREALEDVYAGIEHEVIPGVVETLKVTTARGCERIARSAFEYARQRGRKKVTTVHKANIMKMADGMFLEVSRRVAAEYPEIVHNDLIVDNCAMQMVAKPQQFDVLLLGNLFGDIMSDLCAGLIGGISLVPSINVGEDGIRIYESPHGNAPQLVGRDLANPLPLLTPALHMLRFLGEQEAFDRIVTATRSTLESGILTQDLGGSATTSQLVRAVVDRLRG